MDFLFSLLDGAAALWLSLFSPRRYLRIAAAINIKKRGVRAFCETFVTVNLAPLLALASLQAAAQASLQSILNIAPVVDPFVKGYNALVLSKDLLSLCLLVGAMVAYYSLRRSREFERNPRKFRHALKLITSNLRTYTAAEILTIGPLAILFLSAAEQVMELPPGASDDVGSLLGFLTASPASQFAVVSLGLLYLLLYILQIVVVIRVLVFFARTFRIGFWRSVWLQIRFFLPLAAVAAGVVPIVAWAGLSPQDTLVAVSLMLFAVLIILAVVPAGRTRMARAVVPPRQPSTVALRQAAAKQTGKIRIVEGPLAGMVVPVASTVVIGRDPARAEIVFPAGDTLVSRRHCEIRFDRAAALFEVRDLGSRNGTYVATGPRAARRLEPDFVERVRPGHRLWVGSSRDQVLLELN
jgi:hypothetical protein